MSHSRLTLCIRDHDKLKLYISNQQFSFMLYHMTALERY